MVEGLAGGRRGVRSWSEEEWCKELTGGRCGVRSWSEEEWCKEMTGGRIEVTGDRVVRSCQEDERYESLQEEV
jgi:hypothetical protein